MNVNIRIAKEDEIPLVKEISIGAVWERFSEDQRRELDKEKWSQRMGKLFDMMAKKESHVVFVGEDEDHAFLGYVWVGEGTNMMTGTEHGYIYDVFVEENQRMKGVGIMLMKKAEHYCKKKGYRKIVLMVAANNQPAIKLYTKQDFKKEQIYMGKRLST